MGIMSDYLENRLVNPVFRRIYFESPNEIWVGLFQKNPTDESASHELAGYGYKRELIKFDSPQNGIIKNSHDIIFYHATRKWPKVTHIVLFDAEEGGSSEVYGKLKTPVTINKNKNFVIKTHKLHVGFE